MDRIKEQLVRHEGLRLKPYRSTAGKLTIGFGRNLDDRGLILMAISMAVMLWQAVWSDSRNMISAGTGSRSGGFPSDELLR